MIRGSAVISESDFDLVVNLESLRRTAGGAVHASIHFVVGDACFPEKGWDDFVVVILGWWNEAVTRIARDFSRLEELDFMDGSVCVVLEVNAAGEIDLRCCESRGPDGVTTAARVSRRKLIAALLKVSNEVLETCRRNRWSDDDISRLSDKVAILEGAVD